jgi:hypothetical protein
MPTEELETLIWEGIIDASSSSFKYAGTKWDNIGIM